MNNEYTGKRGPRNLSIFDVFGQTLRGIYKDTMAEPVPDDIRARLKSLDADIVRAPSPPAPK